MAQILIQDLQPAGFHLLSDDQNYLNHLSDEELDITGGATPALTTTAACAASPYLLVGGLVASIVISGVAAYTYYRN